MQNTAFTVGAISTFNAVQIAQIGQITLSLDELCSFDYLNNKYPSINKYTSKSIKNYYYTVVFYILLQAQILCTPGS